MQDEREGNPMKQDITTPEYRSPEIVDYGTLAELTAGGPVGHHEDGATKTHIEPSHPSG